MRTTDGLQTTITCSPVNICDQAFSVALSLEMSLPIPPQDEHLPDQIEAHVHQAGLELQRRPFRVLIEKADHDLVLQQRHGRGRAGIRRRGTRPFTLGSDNHWILLANSLGSPEIADSPYPIDPILPKLRRYGREWGFANRIIIGTETRVKLRSRPSWKGVKRKFPAEIAGPAFGNRGLPYRKNCNENRITFSCHRNDF